MVFSFRFKTIEIINADVKTQTRERNLIKIGFLGGDVENTDENSFPHLLG